MRKVIHKVFWAWDFDKEEKWLNEMAAKGLGLVSVGFCKYEFEDCNPGEYKICLQLLDNTPRHPESQKYIEFLEETGAEHVGSYIRWAYFRKRAADGAFELFSDHASREKYLLGIIRFLVLIIAMNFMIGVNNIIMAITLKSALNYLGFINLAIGLWASYGTLKLVKKRKKMERESRLFE